MGTIWLPTRKRDYDRIAQLANLRPGMVFYDLGSGSGDLLFYLSNKYKIKCVGIEIAPGLYLYSKIRSLFHKRRVEIRYGNFSLCDLSGADVVYCFLHPDIYARLRNKLKSIDNENMLIVLSTWSFENAAFLKVNHKAGTVSYYLYRKSAL